MTRPLAELRVVADGHSVVVRGDDGSFEPLTGQLVLDFDVRALRDDVVRVLRAGEPPPGQRRTAYAHYLEGCRLDEEEVTFDRAEYEASGGHALLVASCCCWGCLWVRP